MIRFAQRLRACENRIPILLGSLSCLWLPSVYSYIYIYFFLNVYIYIFLCIYNYMYFFVGPPSLLFPCWSTRQGWFVQIPVEYHTGCLADIFRNAQSFLECLHDPGQFTDRYGLDPPLIPSRCKLHHWFLVDTFQHLLMFLDLDASCTFVEFPRIFSATRLHPPIQGAIAWRF